LLDVSPVGVRTSFFDLGGHSLLGVRLLNNIEQATGQRLPVAALFKAPTIERLAAMIDGQRDDELYASLVPIRAEGEGLPMYWFHPVSGTVFFYRRLVEQMADGRPHYGLQSQGLDGGVAPFNRIEDMVAHYVKEILAHQPEGPYHLGGWSFGGTLAYEAARQLEALGREVAPVVLIDSKVPTLFDRLGARNEEYLLETFAQNFGLPLDIEVADGDESLLSVNDRLAQILTKAQASGDFPLEIEARQLRRFFEIFKMNFFAMPEYEPGAFAGRVVLFKAKEAIPMPKETTEFTWWDLLVRRLHARAAALRARFWDSWVENDLGWRKVAKRNLRVVRVPGNHFDMLAPDHVEDLARILGSVLSELGSSESNEE
ncbi:MAG: alpha/beta fold hydrolase, partial [Acidobacteria bacterium]|nr:alpha/beta fold hydrolase [Acidobacteriota bacterium]